MTEDALKNVINKAINEERALKYAERKFGVTSIEELKYHLTLIPSEQKEAFEARWGLDGKKCCANYAQLNRKLDIFNGEFLYKEAELSLSELVIFTNSKELSPEIEKALRYLASLVLGAREIGKPVTYIDAKEFFWVINTQLSIKERFMTYRRFGLITGEAVPLNRFVDMLGLKLEDVWNIEAEALHKIASNKDKFIVNK